VDVPEFKQRFRKPAGIVIGLVCQFVFLPLAGFASIRLFYRGDPVHGIPLLVTVCSPGGSYSNWWCSLFNSDLPLSMAMTSASSLFAVATLPINVLIYLKLSYPSEESAVTLDWGGLFTSLAVVVAGIVGGLILGRNKPAWRPRLNAAGNAAGVSLVLLGFFFSSNSSAPVWARADHFYAGVAMPCLFGLVISLAFATACGLPKPQRLSVTIETCYQNTAIALAVILSSFSDDDAELCASLEMTPRKVWAERATTGEATTDLLPPCDVLGIATGIPTFYQVIQIASLLCVCVAGWKAGWTYAPASHGFYRVLSRNYQPGAVAEEPDRLRHEEEEEKEGCVSVSAFKRWWGGELRSADLDETSGDGVDGDGEGAFERRSPSGAVELAQVRVDVEAERGET
jgi:sodium/bile acid cotransporter 2